MDHSSAPLPRIGASRIAALDELHGTLTRDGVDQVEQMISAGWSIDEAADAWAAWFDRWTDVVRQSVPLDANLRRTR